MADNKKISGFKKFTEMKGESKELKEVTPSAQPMTDSDRPANPNLPYNSKKIERMPSRKNIIPKDQNVDLQSDSNDEEVFYLTLYKDNVEMSKLIESIEVAGAEEFSSIRNIPNVEIEPGKKLISKITEDLIKLLSK